MNSTLRRPAVSIVLVRPREQGNVGSVARAMVNMGLADLILIEPATDLGGVARGFGVGAWPVLDAARRFANLEDALDSFELAIGTSAGRDRPLRNHQVLDARDLAKALAPGQQVAIVFGPEDSGLKKQELEQCDTLVRIPCAVEHPTLNLAQAVLLIAYELHITDSSSNSAGSARKSIAEEEKTRQPQVGDRRQLIELTRPVVELLGFDHPHLRESIIDDLRQLLRRAQPDRRQVGLLRRLIHRAAQLRLNSASQPSRSSQHE